MSRIIREDFEQLTTATLIKIYNDDLANLPKKLAEYIDDKSLPMRFNRVFTLARQVLIPRLLSERCTASINRVEVIDANGRSYVNKGKFSVELQQQDDNRTLKVFIV